MTQTQRLALEALSRGALLPYQLYPILFPGGRFNTDIDTGNSKGGPSRQEYAVNMYMGRLEKQKLVIRYAFLDQNCPTDVRGCWVITTDGRKALHA